MKPAASLLLVVLAFTVLAPMNLFTLTIVNDGGSFLGNLDVCHSAAPALSANGDMPCIGLACYGAAPTLFVSFIKPAHPVYFELILTSRNEHPPRS